jgi:UDPglucose--hexose-1-phosphate uridylyltransferase
VRRSPGPEIRYNALTGDPVVVAPGRAARPIPPEAAERDTHLPAFDPVCPFCPGNESRTATELQRWPSRSETGAATWRLRVVANRYPAFVAGQAEAPESAAGGREADGPAATRAAELAVGRHEVIIEHPAHNRDLAGLEDDEVLCVMQAYRARFAEAARDPHVRYVVIFRNRGRLANASLPHPHSQLAGLGFVPPRVAERLRRARARLDAEGRALLPDLAREEVACGDRLIEAGERFATFVPYAPAHEYEVWVAPLFTPPRFDAVDDETLLEVGRVLRRALAALDRALDGVDYNYVLHTPPLEDGAEAAFPWYVQIIPRRTLTGGFELGIGVQILVTPPEEAAARIRAGLSEVAGV